MDNKSTSQPTPKSTSQPTSQPTFQPTSQPTPQPTPISPVSNPDNTPTLYIFISKTCPHCVTYNDKTHPILEKALANTNIKLKKIYPDEDPTNLFGKFGVEYVPTFYCVKGDKKIKVEQIDPKSLIDKFNSM